MKKKGFTIIEMIIALAFLGVIATIFTPIITGSILKVKDSQKYSKDTFSTQTYVENQINEVGEYIKNKDTDPAKTKIEELINNNRLKELEIQNVFGEKIHLYRLTVDIKEDLENNDLVGHGKINVFLTETKPEILTPAIKEVKLTIEGTSDGIDRTNRIIDLTNPSINFDNIKLRAETIICENGDKDLYGETVTEASRASYGISVVNWYISKDKSTSDNPPKTMEDFRSNFYLFREWNSARAEYDYGEHSVINIIKPEGIVGKDLKDYENIVPPTKVWNEIKLNIVSNDGTNLSDEEIDYIYGDRWILATVTPYQATVARSGIEVPAMKNTTWPPAIEDIVIDPIFIKGKSLKIESAKYLVDILDSGSVRKDNSGKIDCNKIIITFDKEISQIENDFMSNLMEFQGLTNRIDKIYPSTTDPKSIIVTFKNSIDTSQRLTENQLKRGSVLLKNRREIDIRQKTSTNFVIEANDLAYSFYKLDTNSKSRFEVFEENEPSTGGIIYKPKYNPIIINNLQKNIDENGEAEDIVLNIEKSDEFISNPNSLVSGNKIVTRFGNNALRWNIGLYDGKYYIIMPSILDQINYDTIPTDYAISFKREVIRFIINVQKKDMTDKQQFELSYNDKENNFTIKPRNLNLIQYIAYANLGMGEEQAVIFSPDIRRDNIKWILKVK